MGIFILIASILVGHATPVVRDKEYHRPLGL